MIERHKLFKPTTDNLNGLQNNYSEGKRQHNKKGRLITIHVKVQKMQTKKVDQWLPGDQGQGGRNHSGV